MYIKIFLGTTASNDMNWPLKSFRILRKIHILFPKLLFHKPGTTRRNNILDTPSHRNEMNIRLCLYPVRKTNDFM